MDRQRILVVDDDADIRRMLTQSLEMSGLEVLQAADGDVALEVLAAGGVAAVITDISMPRRDGLQLVVAMRANPATATIPVIVMTGLPDADGRLAALARTAAITLLRKPVRPSVLLLALLGALGGERHITGGEAPADVPKPLLVGEPLDAAEVSEVRFWASAYEVLLASVRSLPPGESLEEYTARCEFWRSRDAELTGRGVPAGRAAAPV
jgi:CheY-like chemotaxis protein